jgi:hypothetical protein
MWIWPRQSSTKREAYIWEICNVVVLALTSNLWQFGDYKYIQKIWYIFRRSLIVPSDDMNTNVWTRDVKLFECDIQGRVKEGNTLKRKILL